MNSQLLSRLLELWEDYSDEAPLRRALALTVLSCPDESGEVIIEWPLGRRDSALIDFREKLFGERFTGIANCPSCDSKFEIAFETKSIRTKYSSNDIIDTVITSNDRDYHVELRPINSQDLIESKGNRDRILESCIVAINGIKDKPEIQRLIKESVELINECMRMLSECDPQADIQLELFCADCELKWDAPFDISSYLWHEIESWAKRTLREIHLLASTYGWTEKQILELGSRRRQSYLELIAE